MKKLAIVLLIALIPTAFISAQVIAGPTPSFFALELGVGSQMLYRGDIMQMAQGQPDMSKLNYGLEVRGKFSIVRIDASALVKAGSSSVSTIFLPMDVGYSLDLGALRLGLLVGENFYYNPASSQPLSFSTVTPINLKITGDILIGKMFSVGVEAYYFLGSFTDLTDMSFLNKLPMIGSSVMLRL